MKAPQNILVALDSGDASLDAWREACLLARTLGGEVQLAHAIPEAPEGSPDFDVVAYRIEELFKDLRHKAESEGIRVASETIVRSGEPGDLVLDLARERKPDLVVLGAGEKGTLERLLLGSTAERVIREATTPVWLVRPGRAHTDLKRILCAVDDTDPSREALAGALFLARTFTAHLDLLTVQPTGAAKGGTARFRRSCAEEFDLHGAEVEFISREGDAAEQILAAARERKTDLLVMGTAGRTGLARVLHANTAEKVVRRVPCSLLALKTPG